ncbi:MAG: hypothetical protein V8S24_01245 [Gordonibacter pamelaeae]
MKGARLRLRRRGVRRAHEAVASCRWSSTRAAATRASPCSVPLIAYARELGSSDEQLYRALASRTSCHPPEDGHRAPFGLLRRRMRRRGGWRRHIDQPRGGGYKEACHAVVNALSIAAGMVCDGAKPSVRRQDSLLGERRHLGAT